jgi:hypothetical protein
MSAVRDLVEQKDEWPVELQELQSNRERGFVIEFVRNGGHGAQAVRDAGYGDAESDASYYAKTAYRLIHATPRVHDAIVAYSRRFARTLTPKALRVLSEQLDDPSHPPARMRAVSLVLDRADPPVQRVEGEVRHTHEVVDHTREAIKQYRQFVAEGRSDQFLIEWFGPNGADRIRRLVADEEAAQANVIEGEFTEVSPEQDDPDFSVLYPKGASNGERETE